MQRRKRYHGIKDFDTAKAFLDSRGGRWAFRALIQRHTHLVRDSRDATEIRVELWGTPVVIYHQDGTQTLSSGGYHTVTTADRINNWSAARVYSKRGWFIRHSSDGVGPSKIQKCRACRGKGLAWAWCYPTYPARVETCSHHPLIAQTPEGQVLEVFERQSWKVGQTHRYFTDRPCYPCGGGGRQEYGQKPKAFSWDGWPIRVDATGKVIGYERRGQVAAA